MTETAEGRLLIASCSGDGRLDGDPAAPPVPWWSVGKTCLAAAALVLVARRRLALDAPLPDRAYTLRHLLQHTAGLGSYTERPEYLAAIDRGDAPWSDAELLARVRLDPFLFAPGTGWSYSNTGYFLVRRLIEQTTDSDIDSALRALVFAPLGIAHTRVAHAAADLDACAWGNAGRYHPHWVYQGLLIGPPADAALFMHRLWSGDLLPADLLTAMRARHALPPPGGGRPWRTGGYGLGVMMDIASPLGAMLGHSGRGPDSVSAAYHFPAASRSVAAFAPVTQEAVVEHAVLEAAGAPG
jgi:D-alanyl-D-alanine carboxypeptidase